MNRYYQDALLGTLVADAVAMPVHWYYDRDALDRDYGTIGDYAAPQNPHPDSILWRSSYDPPNAKGDILHGHAKYWGQKNIHYHQFLERGENTLNFRLSIELYRNMVRGGGYDPRRWLDRYIELMRDPDFQRDTYVEEYHRGYFLNYAAGKDPETCGIDDVHIGGLSQVTGLLAGLDALGEPPESNAVRIVREHVALTHHNRKVLDAAETLCRLLYRIRGGTDLRDAIREDAHAWVDAGRLAAWAKREDRDVIGNEVSPACYVPGSFVAALFLAWKYAGDFSAGVCANANAGGDNCHRGAVTGALLGAAEGIPEGWLRGLKAMEQLRCDTLEPSR